MRPVGPPAAARSWLLDWPPCAAHTRHRNWHPYQLFASVSIRLNPFHSFINSKHGEINALIALEGSKAVTSLLMRSWHPHRYKGSHIQKKIKGCTTVNSSVYCGQSCCQHIFPLLTSNFKHGYYLLQNSQGCWMESIKFQRESKLSYEEGSETNVSCHCKWGWYSILVLHSKSQHLLVL